MICAIGSLEFSITDYLRFHGVKVTTSNIQRRVTRTPLLDGTTFINNGGFTASDGSVLVVLPSSATKKNIQLLSLMQKRHVLIRVSSYAGCFVGVIQDFKINSQVSFTLLIQR